MKKILLFLALCALTSLAGWAQDDDIYFVPSKNKAASAPAKEQPLRSEYTILESEGIDEASNWAEGRGYGNFDVDAYNRRTSNRLGQDSVATDVADLYADDSYDGGLVTARLIRFHSPRGIIVASPYYLDYYYDMAYYDPWFSSWGWGWRSWYDPFYDPWYWGPSWAWYGGWHHSWGWYHGWAWHNSWHGGWHHGWGWNHGWHSGPAISYSGPRGTNGGGRLWGGNYSRGGGRGLASTSRGTSYGFGSRGFGSRGNSAGAYSGSRGGNYSGSRGGNYSGSRSGGFTGSRGSGYSGSRNSGYNSGRSYGSGSNSSSSSRSSSYSGSNSSSSSRSSSYSGSRSSSSSRSSSYSGGGGGRSFGGGGGRSSGGGRGR